MEALHSAHPLRFRWACSLTFRVTFSSHYSTARLTFILCRYDSNVPYRTGFPVLSSPLRLPPPNVRKITFYSVSPGAPSPALLVDITSLTLRRRER